MFTPSLRKSTKNQLEPQVQLPFPYGYRDYLKLALAKVIPFGEVILRPEIKKMVGTEKECEALAEAAEKELTRKAYQLITFKKFADIDEIEFSLHPH